MNHDQCRNLLIDSIWLDLDIEDPALPTDDEDLLEGSGMSEANVPTQLKTTSAPKHQLTPAEVDKIRKDFYDKYDVDIMRLDISCVEDLTEAPRIKHAKME